MGFASRAGYDSFVMFNLYAQRTPYPHQVHDEIDSSLHQENLEKIREVLQQYEKPDILAAWGQTISVKPFFRDCLNDIYLATKHQDIRWLKIGELTASKHPRHPSRAPYGFGLSVFDLEGYLEKKY